MFSHYSNLPKLPCTASNLPGPTLPALYCAQACAPCAVNPCNNHFDTCHNDYDTCHNPCNGFGFFC
ncbi:hypothetical protein Wcon_01218 [Wolbachia endosymbiont of Cylisticus convexus]|nr:hypothetical protein Wcon_01218 [Wolbachia endosymbiont of Cylisticus convexus]